MYKFEINTAKRCELINIDHLLNQALDKSGLKSGALLLFVPHTTAGIIVNENADPAVKRDILNSLERKIPFEEQYTHLEGNSAAHIKATLTGSSVLVPIEANSAKLGTWQSVFFAEFDGPRRRQVWITSLPG
ncbi:MAG: secondary thiamine-phosphate synthase enzyme YjbQ [bacterium]|nr:secondary thiamine-phosphate synthase enzyme YjbQ [bacterium]